MKLYLAAGEESGDLHGSYLARALKAVSPDAALAGMAGPRMREAGVEALVRSESHGLVGLVELFGRLGQLSGDLGTLGRAMAEDGDALVAIDYGGFNARVVARAKRAGLKTFYYIPPKLWAWGKHRGKGLARDLDLVLAVFPFEVDFWRRIGAEVVFVGHPLMDITRPSGRDLRSAWGMGPGEKLLLVLPGSRRQEIAKLWPPMAEALKLVLAGRDDVRVVVAPAPSLGPGILEEFAPLPDGVTATTEPAVDVMAAADAAITASGTATLELAIMGVPAVIVYKVNRITWEVGRRLVYVDHLGLPNIIAGREVVPELLQDDARPDAIAREATRALDDEAFRRRVSEDYAEIRESLRPPAAADNAAGAPGYAARLIVEALA
ncbi:MAG: lipid-A-disaccharide synthase [Candidatus Zixiibacteriota bacterium]|jgi:lipid-A-disaccharide synthase